MPWRPSRRRDAGSSGRPGPDRRLASRLDRFMAAPTWDRSFRLLARHPELAGERAEALLGELIESARSLGQAGTAVMHLERGRARLLSEALRRTHADLDELRRSHPALARDYQHAADRLSALESAGVAPGGEFP